MKIEQLKAILVEADRLYSTYGLKAEAYECGKWIREVRDAINRLNDTEIREIHLSHFRVDLEWDSQHGFGMMGGQIGDLDKFYAHTELMGKEDIRAMLYAAADYCIDNMVVQDGRRGCAVHHNDPFPVCVQTIAEANPLALDKDALKRSVESNSAVEKDGGHENKS